MAIYEPCKWFKNIKQDYPLDNFVNERSIDMPSLYCEDDKQVMVVNYIQCAKLEDIERVGDRLYFNIS